MRRKELETVTLWIEENEHGFSTICDKVMIQKKKHRGLDATDFCFDSPAEYIVSDLLRAEHILLYSRPNISL